MPQTCRTLYKIATCENKTLPLELAPIQTLLLGHRDYLLRNNYLRMLGFGVGLAVLGTDHYSSTVILLLRTYAIYSKSKRVMIPLSVAYMVCYQASS